MSKIKTVGEELSLILDEIEQTLWEFEANRPGEMIGFGKIGFRASIKIFMCALMEEMWKEQERLTIPQETRAEAAKYFGEEVRKIVKQATNIDTHSLYDLDKDS